MKHDLTPFQAAIAAKYERLTAAFDRADAQAVASEFFAEDGYCIGEGEVTAAGHAAISALFGPFVGVFRFSVVSRQSRVEGSIGWDLADVAITPVDPGPDGSANAFKAVFLWEKLEGEWWCKAQMYVSGAYPSVL